MSSQFYSFKANDIQGREVCMEHFKGKTILLVNTASNCGFTPQYQGLEELYHKYENEGLIILGFPCNQFGNQEPGDEKSISQNCLINYGVSFPMFSKIEVNGDQAHPIFQYLKNQLKGFIGARIKWNFTKFLIDKNGRPIKRFAPMTKPIQIDHFLSSHNIL